MTGRWPAGVLAIFAAGVLHLFSGQMRTITVKTQEVRVDVCVTDHGKAVNGLKPEDFEILDNGAHQEVVYVGQEDAPFDAVLALDLSESVAGDRLFNLRNAVNRFLEELRKNERARLMTFNNSVSMVSSRAGDVARLKADLDLVRPMGSTALIDASYAALMVAESNPDRSLVILFSDGLDTSSWLQEDAVIYAAQHCDAVVYAISMGLNSRTTFLNDLTHSTGGNVYRVETNRNLDRVFLDILDEFRHRYLLTYSPGGTLKAGWHEIEVRIKGRGLKVKARPGYFIDPPHQSRPKS